MPYTRYVVQRGDTLFRIARQRSMNVEALIAANPQLQDPNRIVPGQVIYVPNQMLRQYVIQPGDTMYIIARRLNIPLNLILQANPQVDPQRLQVGQIIYIPDAPATRIVEPMQEYGYDEMVRDLQLLQQRYDFINVSSIGRSVEGRELFVVRLGVGAREVHFNGSFHANEWITTPLLMNFIEDYAIAYEAKQPLRGFDIPALYEQTSLYIVPMVNPDGVELVLEGIDPTNPRYEEVVRINRGSLNFDRWKANIRGVDLNNQFPAFWQEEYDRKGVTQPAPLNYPGPTPLSEPESRAMANFTRQRNFRMVLAFHSQGEVIFWGYRDLEPAESQTIVNRFQAQSGYQPIRTVLSDAGYKDWFILEWRRPGFTVEVGTGVNPLPISQYPKIYEDNIGIMLEALRL
ncbi:peptidase M14 [Desulfuribacillus stibiiarsenatis]|uniref:Peptidase M14 n=1 Tax=Desulfuribacillus stibiiarsenatis TaxID=1390249 RepID=A0A1E5L922_9FIRM|nr:M14 family metallopeptidase [Desulfuribacillus stibiiarsenatis]OEH86657.1 peptidase M14 [Desulfuribacillus stibiiarsenatis]